MTDGINRSEGGSEGRSFLSNEEAQSAESLQSAVADARRNGEYPVQGGTGPSSDSNPDLLAMLDGVEIEGDDPGSGTEGDSPPQAAGPPRSRSAEYAAGLQLIRDRFRNFDTSGDERVTRDEITSYAEEFRSDLSPEQQLGLRQVQHHLDDIQQNYWDDNHRNWLPLQPDSFGLSAADLHRELTNGAAAAYLQQNRRTIDADNDGIISNQELDSHLRDNSASIPAYYRDAISESRTDIQHTAIVEEVGLYPNPDGITRNDLNGWLGSPGASRRWQE